jgi:glycosyltransferase involved in cell wall biosynthesis
VCYCYTPPRFLWGPASGIERKRLRAPLRAALRALEACLRRWDLAAARHVDVLVAQSQTVAARVARVYGRPPAAVVYPPVDAERFARVRPWDGAYFLVVSRFEAYKRIDLAIEACNRLRLPLKIVGDGVERPRLASLAGPTVELLGAVPDEDVVELLAGCRAVVFAGEEDFGLVPLEAQAAGKPVIAYGAGGAVETMVPDVTGELFAPQTADALAAVLAAFNPKRYDPAACRAQAARFAPARFRRDIAAVVMAAWEARATAARGVAACQSPS